MFRKLKGLGLGVTVVSASVFLLGSAKADINPEDSSETTISTSEKPGLLVDKTWSIGIGYSPSSVQIGHRESISDSTVDGLDSDTKVSNVEISVRMIKEFFPEHRFSLSLLASGAYLAGNSESKTEAGVGYAQRLVGMQFGGGVSANLNYYGMGFGFQPYLAAEVFSESATYDLNYQSNDIPVLISNKVRTLVLQPSVGLRIFDPHTSFMSFLSLGTATNLSSNVDSQLNVSNEGKVAFANPESIDANALMIRLGFGVFF